MKCCLLLFLRGLIFSISLSLQAQDNARGELCFVWYNVENMFYPDPDTLPSSLEFTPEGLRHWTWSRYHKKLTALAKVIVASGRGEPPEVVGLCEVQNARVLSELVAHPILAPYTYSYLHKEGSDHRGMEVACLIRMDRMDTVHWETLPFPRPLTATRDMMHLTLCRGGDRLDLFLVHLISKYSGAGATAPLRKIQTGQLVHVMDSVYKSGSGGWMIAAGDFNDNYEAYSMEPLRKARFGGDSLVPVCLEGERGSYKYRGTWSRIDQVLVIRSLLTQVVSAGTLELPPLMIEDQEYGGQKPRRTYEGYVYSGGVSDHLPVVLDLAIPSFSAPDER